MASLAIIACGGARPPYELLASTPAKPPEKTQADLDALAAAEAKRKRKATRKASTPARTTERIAVDPTTDYAAEVRQLWNGLSDTELLAAAERFDAATPKSA